MSNTKIEIAVTLADPAWTSALPKAAALARAAARASLAHAAPRLVADELSILLTGDAAMATLNRDHRGKNGPTNVLSFPGLDGEDLIAALNGSPAAAPRLLGDIVIALGAVAREAKADGKTLAAHFSHLVAHGMLHLLGYDHHHPAEAARMENLETAILAGLGHADPYGETTSPRGRR